MRINRLLRPLNTSDGRDVIKLESRECDECNKEGCDDNNDDIMNYG